MKLRSLFVAVAVALLQLPGAAAVITVSPVTELLPVGQAGLGETALTNGWRIVTNAKGWAKLSTFGPALYLARNMSSKRFVAGAPEVSPEVDLGRGTYYATCDMSMGGRNTSDDCTPSTCWLGTDTWNNTSLHGRTLGSITALEYYSFVDKCPVRCTKSKTEEYWWSDASYMFWNGPMQPIQLQLVVQSPDGSEIRSLWHRPWGSNYDGEDLLDEPGSKKGRWQRIRPLTQGMWYMPATGTTPNTTEQGWTSWSAMLAYQLPDPLMPPFSQWKIADPQLIQKSPGWDSTTNPSGSPDATGTGYGLNFFVGARKTVVNPLFMSGQIRWYNKAYGTRAQIDGITIGFGSEGTETYDFEPAPNEPTVQTVALAEIGLKYPIMLGPDPQKRFLFKVTGRVAPPSLYVNQGFVLDDGSKLTYTDPGFSPSFAQTVKPGPVRIWLLDDAWNSSPYNIGVNDKVTAEGMIEPLRFSGAPKDLMVMWTNVNKLTKHAD